MKVTHEIEIDLTRNAGSVCVPVMKGDAYSRVLRISLSQGRKPWAVPEDAAVVVDYKKPDGTAGVYDAMPDGAAAWEVEEGKLLLHLAPQMLTAAGTVQVRVKLIRGEAVLSVFPFRIIVGRSVGAGAESEDYINWRSAFLPQVTGARAGQWLRISEVDEAGRAVAMEPVEGMTADSIAAAVESYLQENPIQAGATAGEAEQIARNKANIEALSTGKLDAARLPEAINDALAQARDGGEFQGEPGADGKTPVKGEDYFTPAEISEIAEQAARMVDDYEDGSTSSASFTSWLAIGDSITVGYSNDNYSYADILAEKYGVYLVKDAITGTHISTDSDFGTSFANRYSENADDFNLVTVVGGINDWMHGVPLGEFVPETTGTDTFANGMNTLVRGLIEKYPKSKIVFFTSNINNNTSSNGTTNLKFEEYVKVMHTVCSYYSVPFYPLHLLCGFNGLGTYDLNSDTMNTDKTHPLTEGHKKLADAISDCISFVNPSYGYGKGKLEITLKTSLIPEGASTSEIKDCLTVNVVYENGVSVELSDYTVEGSIVEGGESVLTVKYRNISNTLAITGGSASNQYDLLFQLPQAVSVGLENKVVDLGYAPFTEASPRTIKAVFNADSETTAGVALLRAYVDNANTFVGLGVNAVGSAKRMSLISPSNNTTLMASDVAGDYLTYPKDMELFIVWDGANTVTAYVVDATGIKWRTNNLNWTVPTGDGTLKFGWNHTSRYWTGTLSDLKVWGQAFTEQDVLNNI